MLKTKEFRLPSVHESLEVAPIKIDHFDFKSMEIVNSANRLKFRLTGLHLRLAKVNVKVNHKIFKLFLLQVNERAKRRKMRQRRTLLRNKIQRELRKEGEVATRRKVVCFRLLGGL